jgi:hypothetical protein
MTLFNPVYFTERYQNLFRFQSPHKYTSKGNNKSINEYGKEILCA